MHNFKELIIWNKSRELVKKCYKIINVFPANEKYGLTQQIQRASVSIPTNIAEGSGKTSGKDFVRYLEISISSAFELETLFFLAYDLGFISEETHVEINNHIQEIQKMIYAFKKKILKENSFKNS